MISTIERLEANEHVEREYLIEESIATGIAIGEATGISTGEKKKALEIAKKMIKRGIDLQDIIEDTGLSISEIQTLLKNTRH